MPGARVKRKTNQKEKMKNQDKKKSKKDSNFTPEQEEKIYKKILKGERPTDWSGGKPHGSSHANWDKSFVIDVGDGDKIRVWEKNGKLTYPQDDPNFARNTLYRKKFATALSNYKKSSSPSIEKIKTQSGHEIYRKNSSSFSGTI